MRFLRSLFGDVGLMGLAIVFAWALWYTVREDLNETQKHQVDLVFATDDGIDVTPRTQTVTLMLQGPRRAVDALRGMLAPRVVRRLTVADLPAGADETRLDFTKDRFDFTDALGGDALTVMDMQPQSVSVKLYRVVVQQFSVAPPDLVGASDLGLKHVLQGYTNTAKVRGAVTVLSTFREIRTLVGKEQLQGFAESLKDSPKTLARLVLEIDPSQRDLFTLVEPKELVARVELSRVAEQEIVVPIQIYDTAAKGARPSRRLQFAELNKPHFLPGDPPRVKLQVTGVPSALAGLTASKIRAFVVGADLADDQRNGDVPVHVADLPPGVALSQDYSVYVEETR